MYIFHLHIFAAQVNQTISTCASSANILVLLIFLSRMVFGVFGSGWAVGVYFYFRISPLFIISLITNKTLLLIAFIIDFHTMTGENQKDIKTVGTHRYSKGRNQERLHGLLDPL